MAKRTLLAYEAEQFQALNPNGLTFILTMQVITWFGLRKRIIKVPYEVPDHKPLKLYTDHWDKMIETQQIIRK